MKTLKELIEEVSLELKMMAANRLAELSEYPVSVRDDMSHQTGSMRRDTSLPFTERTAAEIIHYASSIESHER